MQTTDSMTANTVTNFMGGESYKLNPLQSMQIVCTSMICGEAQYYRATKVKKDRFKDHFIFQMFYDDTESSNDYFTTVVSAALDYDFPGTLAFIEKLRNEYFMRLNSHFLITQAVHHPKRGEFNQKNPKVFRKAIEDACNIPTDWTSQYKLLKESGKPIPTIWKKAIADQLQKMTCYHAAKYIHGSKTQGKTNKMLANIVDLIRITHPKPTALLNDLVKHGKVVIQDHEQTWEKLRSQGKSWVEINTQIRLPHMALLRNLSNILDEYASLDHHDATEKIQELVTRLVAGVKSGKQFPFRYYSAHKRLTGNDGEIEVHSRKRARKPVVTPEPIQDDEPTNADKHRTAEQQVLFNALRTIVLDGLNQCLLESLETIPQLPGRVDCLTDNSGSARGGIVSEYGTVRVYEISNLSAILSAFRSTEGGSVWIFGDRLEEYPISKEKSILTQLDEVNAIGSTVGGGTETGVWLFWEKVIHESKHLDHVFIYSDMQAGTGQLYAANCHIKAMQQLNCALNPAGSVYINVLSLVNTYREKVNPKTNVFSVQVAGYDNSILPDILYRGALLSGWTGKEARMAYEISLLWDKIETAPIV
jgi:hypothetical protein